MVEGDSELDGGGGGGGVVAVVGRRPNALDLQTEHHSSVQSVGPVNKNRLAPGLEIKTG